ncbi:MAG: alpha-ketoglutarate-dependent dioxygenase AlkB [Saprospiraceae bacterium]
MSLTAIQEKFSGNLLPYDGEVYYYGPILNEQDSIQYLNKLLLEIEWKNDEAKIFGKHFITKRKVAWYGDDGFDYSYSNTTRSALSWSKELIELRSLVIEKTQSGFNSCLLNLYHDGDEGMAWHSDDEKSLQENAPIASLSFGAARRFLFRHRKTLETIELMLSPGSLLIMQGNTQSHWVHSLPKSKRIKSPRINLTFRSMKR